MKSHSFEESYSGLVLPSRVLRRLSTSYCTLFFHCSNTSCTVGTTILLKYQVPVERTNSHRAMWQKSARRGILSSRVEAVELSFGSCGFDIMSLELPPTWLPQVGGDQKNGIPSWSQGSHQQASCYHSDRRSSLCPTHVATNNHYQ